MLNDKIEHYKETRQMLKNTPAQYKHEFPFLKDVDSLAFGERPTESGKSLQKLLPRQVRWFPNFKAKHKSKASYTTNNQGGNIRIENGKIKLPKIGFVK